MHLWRDKVDYMRYSLFHSLKSWWIHSLNLAPDWCRVRRIHWKFMWLLCCRNSAQLHSSWNNSLDRIGECCWCWDSQTHNSWPFQWYFGSNFSKRRLFLGIHLLRCFLSSCWGVRTRWQCSVQYSGNCLHWRPCTDWHLVEHWPEIAHNWQHWKWNNHEYRDITGGTLG